MLELLFASENMLFTVALIVVLIIGLLEGVTTLLGFGLSGLLDSLLPDVDLDVDVDVDLDGSAGDAVAGAEAGDGFDLAEVGHPTALSRLLGWLHIGRVPILILLLIFLFAFGFTGLFVQEAARTLTRHMLPSFIAAAPALIAGVMTVRVSGKLLARIIPKDHTEAVSEESFVGRIATITLGTARAGQPAQARLRDQHGQTHYVMVEPDEPDQRFEIGTAVLLVKRDSHVFRAIVNPNSMLVD